MAASLDILCVQGLEGQIIKKTMFPKLLLIIIIVLSTFTCSSEQGTPGAHVLLACSHHTPAWAQQLGGFCRKLSLEWLTMSEKSGANSSSVVICFPFNLKAEISASDSSRRVIALGDLPSMNQTAVILIGRVSFSPRRNERPQSS